MNIKNKLLLKYGKLKKKDKLIIYFGYIFVILAFTKLPPYQLISIYVLPHNESDLHDPTFEELQTFLRVNQIDKNEYQKHLYNCVSFTKDLLLDAKGRGIRGYFVIIELPKSDPHHAIAMFETVDKGTVYIEPQNDNILNPTTFDVVYTSLI